jgi:hypothetical protein
MNVGVKYDRKRLSQTASTKILLKRALYIKRFQFNVSYPEVFCPVVQAG